MRVLIYETTRHLSLGKPPDYDQISDMITRAGALVYGHDNQDQLQTEIGMSVHVLVIPATMIMRSAARLGSGVQSNGLASVMATAQHGWRTNQTDWEPGNLRDNQLMATAILVILKRAGVSLAKLDQVMVATGGTDECVSMSVSDAIGAAIMELIGTVNLQDADSGEKLHTMRLQLRALLEKVD